ncbi:dTDP-3-amino-3,6-dideoxy-alpha-D-galactopyranose transaminase [bacterium BMS3Bbin08]|nr:dTDP-3-amino-3,6-dideoxy-alpha-D-galactopyranose transaminase [bacterium BMS3Bbin08]
MTHIPFLDINTPHAELEGEFLAVFREALRTGRFVGGPEVEGFEQDFADFCDTDYCVGVGSGTDALRFALIAAGVQAPNDIVITVPNTFIATTEAISQAGATPAFVDIDPKTYNMDANKLEDYLKKHSALRSMRSACVPKAVIPVHLYGQMADMDPILEIAQKYNLIVIEDACQAHGAEYFSRREDRWKKAGSMGKAAAFSFYPGKNLGACGEGGAVMTNDNEVARKIRMLRDHGQVKKYFHEMDGYNGRLDAIQAGFLRIKFRHLPQWNEKRRQNAYLYNKLLSSLDEVQTPYEPEWTKSVYHLYVIRAQNRDDLQKYLLENQISTGLHYPVPLHLQKAYKNLGHRAGDFPVSEKIAKEILSLPMYPDLTGQQQERVVETIKKWITV